MAPARKHPYEVRLTPAAARSFKKLEAELQRRLHRELARQAARAADAATGKRGGKSAKALQGRADRFFRLRVGDYRLMYDVLDDEQVVLVLGVVHRRDLDRWLRGN